MESRGSQIEYKVVEGELPPGMQVNWMVGMFVGGTPGRAGVYDFTVEARNSGGAARKRFSITVLDAPTAAVFSTPSALHGGIVGVLYQNNFVLTGGSASMMTLLEGQLPPGLAWMGSLLTGTPTAAGSYTFTLKGINSTGSDVREFTINIAEAPEYDGVYLPEQGFSPVLGMHTTWQVTALGGATFVYEVVDGELPPGMARVNMGASQTFSVWGVPSRAGSYSVTLKATDTASGQSATRKYLFTVSDNSGEYFSVSAAASFGGSVTPEYAAAVVGSSVTVKSNPRAGYRLSALYVNGRNVGAHTSYTIKNIRTAYTVRAVFVPIHSHSYAWVVDTPPTQDQPGSQHEECACGERRDTREIPPLGAAHTHDYAANGWQSDVSSHWQQCVCGDYASRQEHSFGDWTTISRATRKQAGIRSRVCSVCGYAHSEDIPALGAKVLYGWGIAAAAAAAVIFVLARKKKTKNT